MSARFGRSDLLIFSAALTVRAAHLWAMRHSPFFQTLLGDAAAYDTWAQQIVGGDWVGRDVFYQAPLYAYFLAAIYSVHHSLVLVRVCQAVLGAASCALLGYAARQIFGRSAGLAAGLILAVYAPAVFFDGLVQKSVVDVFLICLLLAMLSRLIASPDHPGSLGRWFSIGATLGALGLTRENALVFVPVMIGWTWWRPAPRRGRGAAMLLIGLSLVLLPVGLRNLVVGGEFHLTTTQSGPNFFIGNNPRADGTYVPLKFGRGSPEYERLDATELASQAEGRALSSGEVSSYWAHRAFDYIETNPVDWLALEGRKLWLLFNATETIDTESQESHEDESPPLRAIARVAHFGVLLPLACVGFWLTWHDRRRVWLLQAMAGAYALSLLVFYVVARYRMPLAPFLIVFASAAVGRWRAFVATSTRWRALAAGMVLAPVAILCNLPAASADAMRAATYQNLGAALLETGRPEEAAAAFRRALTLKPDFAPAHSGLGSVLRSQGKSDEAVSHLEEALRLAPDHDDARFNLANALSDRGRLPEAIAHYQELVRRKPGASDIHSNLGAALEGANRIDEAIQQFRAAVTITPDAAKPRYNLGHTLLTRGDLGEAVEQLSRATQLDPTDAAAHYELGNAYLARQQATEAVEQFRAAIRLSPQLAEGHNNLGIALGSLGRLDEAIEEFRTAVRIDPGSGEAQANLKTALGTRRP